MTRLLLRPLLWRCTTARNRQLLQKALQVHGWDSLLGSAWLLTYLGLCPMARVAKQLKTAWKGISVPAPMGIDLQASPQAMFEALGVQPEKARLAAAAGKSA